MSNFSLLDTLNGSRWDTSANNINTVGYVSCNGGTAVGTYYSNNGSAFRVPNGPTSSRPSPGLVGYLRFNTDQSYNCLEYYDPLSALWTPIYPIPGITSVTPDFVTDTSGASGGGSYYNTNPLVISGYGYVPGCTVSYRGIDSSVYAAPSTIYVSSTQIKATVPASVYNGYNQDPFTIVVTNPTGVSGFLLNALDVDPSASWVTPAGAITNNLGGTTVDSSYSLTTSTPIYFRVQAIDLEGNAVTYNSPDLSSNSATSKCAITTSGGFGYITGAPYSLTNATVSFTVNALDGRAVVPRNFSLTVNAALRNATASSSGGYAFQVTYTDAAGQNPTSSGPYVNGYTVYTFNPNPNPLATPLPFPPAAQGNGTIQQAVATYTFTPLFTSGTIAALVVGGGGAGAGDGSTNVGSGGGGGGGVLYNSGSLTMNNGTSYTITVGAGGYTSGSAANLRHGASSTIIGSGFTTLTGVGGGGGGNYQTTPGAAGGSGGGASAPAGYSGGSSTQTSTGGTGYGNSGGTGANTYGGGGGGAGGSASGTSQNGGNGISISITGSATLYGGGGGGSGTTTSGGGNGGGGTGGQGNGTTSGTNGTAGTGGGGGAQINSGTTVGQGGSGIVVIRFKSYSD